MIKIYEPYKIADAANKVFQSVCAGKLTYQNEDVAEATRLISSFHNNLPTILMFNGTCATHMAFKALKLKVPNLKRVIVPNNVYVAAWNSMLMDYDDLELVPVDADEKTWCVNIESLDQELRVSDPSDTGVLVVHNIGGIVNVPKLKRKWHDFSFIEDNCEGLFGKYENLPSGTESLASSLSFYANKTVTCGEGGALIINDDNSINSFIERQYSQGQTSTRYVHDILAYNYRITNIQSSMLISQLAIKDEILSKKNDIFEFYRNNLSKYFSFQEPEADTQHSKWMFSVRLRDSNYHNEVSKSIVGFETRPMFYPMSAHKHLKKFSKPDNEIIANTLSKECFMIPSHPNLTEKDTEVIVETLNRITR